MKEMLTSVQNPLVKQLSGLKEKKIRDVTRMFLIEGVRFVEEALQAGISLRQVMYSPGLLESERGEALLADVMKTSAPVQPVSDKVLAHISDTESPQGVLAALDIPALALEGLKQELPFFLVVDGIQDPGNLGTLIRSALASGAKGIICTRGTVDLFNPKTLRSTMGAVFKIPLVNNVDQGEAISWLREKQIPVAVADAAGKEVYYCSVLTPPLAIVIGNEGQGPSEEFRAAAARRVSIPLQGGVESLNAAVAGSLLLFESARQIFLETAKHPTKRA